MATEPSELLELLAQIHEHLASMHALLGEESSSLQTRNADSLQSVTSQKLALADRINELTARQKQLLEASGFSADRDGMEGFLTQCNEESSLNIWQKVLVLTADCKHRNDINGAYLALLERYVESTLDILTGSPSMGETYDPKGSKRRGSSSHRSFTV
ncbi:MAG: flagella synthesis protein FlgN [Methylococcaceae bacterium]